MTRNQAIIEATQYQYDGLRGEDERELYQTILDTGVSCRLGGAFPVREQVLVERGEIETRS